jgi:teichuronic acid biosynthesis glycosyltransferase TuaG
MENHLISIITPSYNSSRFIVKTIDSIQKQSYKNWELIIVDDCSKDNSVEIINSFSRTDSRIQLIGLDKNVGAAEARNIALRQAKGRYIAFLDSDDIWCPTKLDEQMNFMSTNDYAFSFTAYDIINEEGEKANKLVLVPLCIDYRNYLKNTIIGCLTVMIDKEKVGYFEMPVIRSSHDMALWLLIMRRGFKAYGLNSPLASYRVLTKSNTSNKIRAAMDVWKVYREIEKINILSSLYYFINYSFNAIKKRV